jgi:hypothetical protein
MLEQVHPEVLPDAHTAAGHIVEDTGTATTILPMRQ